MDRASLVSDLSSALRVSLTAGWWIFAMHAGVISVSRFPLRRVSRNPASFRQSPESDSILLAPTPECGPVHPQDAGGFVQRFASCEYAADVYFFEFINWNGIA
jgi:hypothetical protein